MQDGKIHPTVATTAPGPRGTDQGVQGEAGAQDRSPGIFLG